MWRFHRRHPTVLLAHADPFVRAELEGALQQDGYRLVPAHTGDDVVHALAGMLLDRGRFLDLAIVDHALIGGSARELLDELRSADKTVPLVLLTDGEQPPTEPSSVRWYHAVFRWPCDPDDLRTAALNLVSPPSARHGSGIFKTRRDGLPDSKG